MLASVVLWHFGAGVASSRFRILRVKSKIMARTAGRNRTERRRRCCSGADVLFLKHVNSILRQSSYPVCGFAMMEQVRLYTVWPKENWLGSSMNHIQGWMTVWECYYHAFERGCLWVEASVGYSFARHRRKWQHVRYCDGFPSGLWNRGILQLDRSAL